MVCIWLVILRTYYLNENFFAFFGFSFFVKRYMCENQLFMKIKIFKEKFWNAILFNYLLIISSGGFENFQLGKLSKLGKFTDVILREITLFYMNSRKFTWKLVKKRKFFCKLLIHLMNMFTLSLITYDTPFWSKTCLATPEWVGAMSWCIFRFCWA